MSEIIKNAYGCLVGAAIGDAMGMPASFMTQRKIKRIYGRINGFVSPRRKCGSCEWMAKGKVTDDTDETLIIASVLIEAGEFDQNLFVKKMKDWAKTKKILEHMLVGPSTKAFLETIIGGGDFLKIGRVGDTNGGAMRVAPVGIFNHGNLTQAILDGIASGIPSHGSKPGLAATAAIASATALAVEDNCTASEVIDAAILGAKAGEQAGFDISAPSVTERIRSVKELVDSHSEKRLEDISNILYSHIGAGMKSYESIPFSLGMFYASKGDYTTALLATINTGDDADTNGAIVGALCGAFGGVDRINQNWIKEIEKTNKIDFYKIANTLLSAKRYKERIQ